MLSDKDMIERMERGWRGGKSDGTVCGQGSTIHNTRRIAEWLPEIIKQYGIRSINDAGAGDLHWADSVEWPCQYTAYDLIPRDKSIVACDITTQRMLDSHAILCRMVLNHLVDNGNYERVNMALELFKESSKYLFATHFVDGGPERSRQFTRLDLSWWLGDPLELCRDGHEENCHLAMWRL